MLHEGAFTFLTLAVIDRTVLRWVRMGCVLSVLWC